MACKLSYKRGCQEKNPPRSLQGDIDVVLCIQPRLWRGGVFVLAALSSLVIPGRPTQLMVATRGFHAAMVRRLRIRKLRKQRDWLSANHDPIGGSRPIAFLGRARHLSRCVKRFFSPLTMRSTKYPQRFHNVFPVVTMVLSGEPRFTSAPRYVSSS